MSSAMWGKATAGIIGSWVDSSSSGISRYTYTNVVFGDTYVTVTGLGSWAGVSKAQNLLVTQKQMKDMGWNASSSSMNSIAELNYMLYKYGITNQYSIALFLATCANETGYGYQLQDIGTSGTGYMQLTGPMRQEFLDAINDKYKGNLKSYIAENYAWESAAWLWSSFNYSGITLNNYIANNVNNYSQYSRNYGDFADFLRNIYLITSLYVNYGDSRGGVTREERDTIVAGTAKWSVSGKVLTVNSNLRIAPENWSQDDDRTRRINTFHSAMKVFNIK